MVVPSMNINQNAGIIDQSDCRDFQQLLKHQLLFLSEHVLYNWKALNEMHRLEVLVEKNWEKFTIELYKLKLNGQQLVNQK